MPGDRKSDDHDETCPWCHGSGREAGHHGLSERKCRPCNGTGERKEQIRERRDTGGGAGSGPDQGHGTSPVLGPLATAHTGATGFDSQGPGAPPIQSGGGALCTPSTEDGPKGTSAAGPITGKD